MGFHGVICSATQLLKMPASSGPPPNNQNQPGSWSNAVAYLSLHGAADTTIPPAGGPLFGSSTFELHSVAESTRLFAELNGCELSPLVWSIDALIYFVPPTLSPTTADVTTYSCDPTTPVTAYMVQGGGHEVAARRKNGARERRGAEDAVLQQCLRHCDAQPLPTVRSAL